MTRFNSKNTVIIITVFLLIISIFSPNISSNTVSNNNIALEESSEIKTSPLLFKIPVQAFSMSGFHNESNPDPWKGERRLVDGYFSKWVKDVVGDNKLSKDLQKINNQAQAAIVLADRINWLKNKQKTN